MNAPIIQVDDRTGYRADIDGLRAVAVLSVMAYHYSAPLPWPLLPGGFTGVDVFFVISGFLITSKITDDIRSGTFSVLSFYDRRIRRIFPALLVMLAVTLFVGSFLLLPGDYKSLANSAATAAFGLSNFFFLNNTGYFDRVAELQPLLHTWSLAVEEQFYVVWPLLLLLLVRGRNWTDTAAAIVVVAIFGFGASLFWRDVDPKGAFFMALPRAWELAVGGALVFLPRLPRWGGASTMLGLAICLAGFVFIGSANFPGSRALVPCIGAALVIWPKREPSQAAAWLGRLAPIGRVSYSLYLWHWPVWVLFRFYINNGQPRIREAFALAAVSMALAVLSYLYVERPFRTQLWRPTSTVWFGLAACTVIFWASMYIASSDGKPSRVSRDGYAMGSLELMWDWPCTNRKIFETLPPVCTFGAAWLGDNDKAILWGDSNAEQLTPLIDLVSKAANVSVAGLFPCPAILDGEMIKRAPDPSPGYNQYCGGQRATILKLLPKHPEVKTVILAGSWAVLFHIIASPTQSERSKLLEVAFRDTIKIIQEAGKKVVLVATIPQWNRDPVPCSIGDVGLLRRWQCSEEERNLARQQVLNGQSISLDVFERIATEFPSIKLILPVQGLCKTDQCTSRINGESIYRDAGHLRRNLLQETNGELAKQIGLDRVF